jgi:His-Xaa-Ser system radical SAM maturase HxsC
MCSQPPIPRDHPEIPDRLLRLIQLIAPLRPEHIAVTGGEPTLLGVGFLETLAALRKYLPETAVSVLTNGRNFKDPDFVRRIAACSEPVRTLFSIPLHADVAKIHNRIAGCQGAFEETLAGLYNSSGKLRLEIRVIIHRLTVPRLRALADFIYSSLPFIRHVIFMGIENIGLARVNSDKLSIGNQEIIEPLAAAVEYLHLRGILVSLYNMQLCLLPRELWGFCRQSISDYKATYADACHACGLLRHCGGIFTSADPVHIASLRPVSSVFPSIDPSLPIYERNSSTRRLEL